MTPHLVLGIDPGPEESGWMLLRALMPRTVYVDGGKVASSKRPFLDLLVAAEARRHNGEPHAFDGMAVAIERPRWQDHGRDPRATRAIAANLIETIDVAARFSEIAKSCGYKVIELPAQTWRLGVVGVRGPTDAAIKRTIEALVAGLPSRTNVHMRDAGGVAIAAARLIHARRDHEHASVF